MLLHGVMATVKGILVMLVWNWYIVPTFALPALPLVVAVVMLLTLNVISIEIDSTRINENGELMQTTMEDDLVAVLTFIVFSTIVGFVFYGLTTL